MEIIDSPLRVYIRIRPLSSSEIQENQRVCWKYNETTLVEETNHVAKGYKYDKCFGPEENNRSIYQRIGKGMVMKVMEGYHATFFAYGQSASGKTHTLKGQEDDPGLIMLAMKDIVEFIETHSGIRYSIKFSCYQISNESINDLLGDNQQTNLRIVSEDPIKGAVVGSLSEVDVKTRSDFLELLRKTERNRFKGPTHIIYRIHISSISGTGMPRASEDISVENQPGMMKSSYLTVVDLAGTSGTLGHELLQKSYLALTAVVNQLSENAKHQEKGRQLVPYRDSVLTRALKQSLGGNSMTCLICTVSPTRLSRDNTLSTLQFGQLCQTISNNVHKNLLLDDPIRMKQSELIIAQLRKQLSHYESDGASKRDRSLVLLSGGDSQESLLKEKIQLEERVRELQQLLANSTTSDGKMSLNYLIHYKSISRIATLQDELQDVRSLDQLKDDWNEYEKEMEIQFNQIRFQLEKENILVKTEKERILAERTHLDEKESRLGVLLAELDERESKLRQHQNIIKEEQNHWQQAIVDLTRREELVIEWQQNYKQREKKIKDMNDNLDKKLSDINSREANISEREQQLLIQQRSLVDRDQKIQISIKRSDDLEKSQRELEERLNHHEADLLLREKDLEQKERDLILRKKELDQLDTVFREKERKFISEQKHFEEREETVKRLNEQLKEEMSQSEILKTKLQEREHNLQLMEHKYLTLMEAQEKREKIFRKEKSQFTELKRLFTRKEKELLEREESVARLEKKYEDFQQREEQLALHIRDYNEIVEKFFSSDLEKISILHVQQMTDIEGVLTDQMKVINSLSKELQHTRDQIGRVQLSENEGMAEKSRTETAKILQKIIQDRNEVTQKHERELVEREKERELVENQLANDMKTMSQNVVKNHKKPDEDLGLIESHRGYMSIHRSLVASILEMERNIKALNSLPKYFQIPEHEFPKIVASTPNPEIEKHKESLLRRDRDQIEVSGSIRRQFIPGSGDQTERERKPSYLDADKSSRNPPPAPSSRSDVLNDLSHLTLNSSSSPLIRSRDQKPSSPLHKSESLLRNKTTLAQRERISDYERDEPSMSSRFLRSQSPQSNSSPPPRPGRMPVVSSLSFKK